MDDLTFILPVRIESIIRNALKQRPVDLARLSVALGIVIVVT
jgi:hypothetical protein